MIASRARALHSVAAAARTVAWQRPALSSVAAVPVRFFSMTVQREVKKYTESHEWIEISDGSNKAKIGITKYAASALGDVIYVELPDADLDVSAGEPVGAVESVKSASDVLSPISGKVVRGNEILEDNAKTINESPEGEGWICEIEVADAAELDALLDEAAYNATIDGDNNGD